MTDISKLATAALPTSDDDWGSERQIDAENAFFAEVRRRISRRAFRELEGYCLKARTEEMVAEALRLVACEEKRVRAVDAVIAKDRRIGGREAKLIHKLLK